MGQIWAHMDRVDPVRAPTCLAVPIWIHLHMCSFAIKTSASIRLHALVLMSSGYGPVLPQPRWERLLVYGPSPAGPPPATPLFRRRREDHWREEVERNQAIIQGLEQQQEDQRQHIAEMVRRYEERQQLVASLSQGVASRRQHIAEMERRYEERFGPLPSESIYRAIADRMESDTKMEV